MSQLPRPEPVPASRAPEPQPKPVPVPAAPASFVQFPPRLHNEVYPFIAPSRFRGALGGSVGAAGSGDAGTVPKVVLITGAAGTLGSALAECFAITGAKLVLTYNRTPLPDSLRQRCFDLGAAGVRFAQCNVTDLASCEQLISNVLGTEEDGVGGRIDVLVNNAGSNDLNPVG